MTKRQLIDEILKINRSARPSFLAKFDDSDLDEYLGHLQAAAQPRRRSVADQPAAADPPAASTTSKADASAASAAATGAEGATSRIDEKFTSQQTPAKQRASASPRPAASHSGRVPMAAASERERDRTIRSSIADERSQRWLF